MRREREGREVVGREKRREYREYESYREEGREDRREESKVIEKKRIERTGDGGGGIEGRRV